MNFKLQHIALAAGFALVAMAAPTLADPIRIGFNVPLTGFAAADGNSALTGAQLAVEQVNGAGGINGDMLELVVYDDQASPKESAPLAVKLTTQDEVIAGISGSYSGATRAAATIYQEEGVPYISAYAVHPDITRAGDYVFRTSFMGEVQGRAGAKLIGGMMGLKRVAVITLNNDFGKSLAAGFKERAANFGIEIVSEYEYSIKDREFGPIVSSVKADAPEAIYASGYLASRRRDHRPGDRAGGLRHPEVHRDCRAGRRGGDHHHLTRPRLGRPGGARLHRGLRGQGGLPRRHGRGLWPHRRSGHGRGAEEGGSQ
jgi:branched-chain amino acid transport system substrate-binding protein